MKITSQQINHRTTKHTFTIDGHSLNFSEWIHLMLNSDKAILTFNQTLSDSEFKAFFWEVKPVNTKLLDQEFEFVLVDSLSLRQITPDKSSFKKYFSKNSLAVHFTNLGRDAELIAPSPIHKTTKYQHIASFVRTAEQDQIIAFWHKVISTYSKNIGDQLKWLSTSGLGVYWLHARIDSRPKYYQHAEYKQ